MNIRPLQTDDTHISFTAANETLLHHQSFDSLYKPVANTEKDTPLEKEDVGFVAEDSQGVVMGVISGVFVPSPKDRNIPMAILQNIWVNPLFRQQGVATALHDRFIADVKDRGAKMVDIHVDVHNKEGNVFWNALPYEVYQERRRMLL